MLLLVVDENWHSNIICLFITHFHSWLTMHKNLLTMHKNLLTMHKNLLTMHKNLPTRSISLRTILRVYFCDGRYRSFSSMEVSTAFSAL